MFDVGVPTQQAKDMLRRRIQDLEEYNELQGFRFTLQEPDIKNALISAMGEYNDILYKTTYTMADLDNPSSIIRPSFFMRLAESYAYQMIFTRKLWNAVAYNDSGLSINETAILPFMKALFEQSRALATRQIDEAKNADSINASFVTGYSFEY